MATETARDAGTGKLFRRFLDVYFQPGTNVLLGRIYSAEFTLAKDDYWIAVMRLQLTSSPIREKVYGRRLG